MSTVLIINLSTEMWVVVQTEVGPNSSRRLCRQALRTCVPWLLPRFGGPEIHQGLCAMPHAVDPRDTAQSPHLLPLCGSHPQHLDSYVSYFNTIAMLHVYCLALMTLTIYVYKYIPRETEYIVAASIYVLKCWGKS